MGTTHSVLDHTRRRRLLPREMETAHLRNILDMVILKFQVKCLCKALLFRGQKLGFQWEALATSSATMRSRLLFLKPVLKDIEDEVLRRGLAR